MRIADVCTRLEDGIAIAALYRCLLRMLWRLKRHNQRWRIYARMLINENRWRAARYGIDESLVDFGRRALVPYADLLEEILALVREDAEHLGCLPEVEHARSIVRRGTSAHAQRRIFEEARRNGAAKHEALQAVVDWLIETTKADLPPPRVGAL
jgi:carboxylate-amine ligase